ncbi:MAG: DUF805 domain-containing protein [Proteobacteria bacterium]|nr:DUF805 domain-containing protein [Pseudomonadota bacterium]
MTPIHIWKWRGYATVGGRLNGAAYRSYAGIYFTQFVVGAIVLAALAFAAVLLGDGFLNTIAMIVVALAVITGCVYLSVAQICILVRRLHDFGYSGWWILLIFPLLWIADGLLMGMLAQSLHLPKMPGLVSGLFGLLLFFMPGDEEENEYGSPVAAGDFVPTPAANVMGWVVVGLSVLSLLLAPWAPEKDKKDWELQFKGMIEKGAGEPAVPADGGTDL